MFDSEAYLRPKVRPTDVSGAFLHRFLLKGEGELLGLARIFQSRAIVENDGERNSMDCSAAGRRAKEPCISNAVDRAPVTDGRLRNLNDHFENVCEDKDRFLGRINLMNQ